MASEQRTSIAFERMTEAIDQLIQARVEKATAPLLTRIAELEERMSRFENDTGSKALEELLREVRLRQQP